MTFLFFWLCKNSVLQIIVSVPIYDEHIKINARAATILQNRVLADSTVIIQVRLDLLPSARYIGKSIHVAMVVYYVFVGANSVYKDIYFAFDTKKGRTKNKAHNKHQKYMEHLVDRIEGCAIPVASSFRLKDAALSNS